MKKIMATIALIMALSLTAFAGHNNIAPPDGSASAQSQDAAVETCPELRGHDN